MTLSTHVLDAGRGRPAAGIAVRWETSSPAGWALTADGRTDADGRVTASGWSGSPALAPGRHRLVFDVEPWATAQGVAAFFPEVTITFTVTDPAHHHVPLLLSPYAYSTYRGT